MNKLKKILDYYNNKKYTSLSEKAYDMIEEMIVSLILKPGSFYSETELSDMIGIGRTPVREAIKKLENTYMVEIIPRRGIKIAEVRLEDFFLQIEVRRMLEKLIAVRAAKFSTPSEREKFIELANRYDKATNAGDEIESIRIDNEFNHFVADCSRNPFAKNALMPFHSIARRLYFMQYKVETDLITKINKSHSDLMRAISTGNTNKTSEISDALLNHIEDLIKLQLDFLSAHN